MQDDREYISIIIGLKMQGNFKYSFKRKNINNSFFMFYCVDSSTISRSLIVANVLNSGIEENVFEFLSGYYNHFSNKIH